MKLRYTTRAKLDLAEIHDYIAQENPSAARRVILIIRNAAKTDIEPRLILVDPVIRDGRMIQPADLLQSFSGDTLQVAVHADS